MSIVVGLLMISSSFLVQRPVLSFFFFFNDTATTEIYTLSLHDALPICRCVPLLILCVTAERSTHKDSTRCRFGSRERQSGVNLTARRLPRLRIVCTALAGPANAAALDSQKSERCYWGIGEAASRKIRTV